MTQVGDLEKIVSVVRIRHAAGMYAVPEFGVVEDAFAQLLQKSMYGLIEAETSFVVPPDFESRYSSEFLMESAKQIKLIPAAQQYLNQFGRIEIVPDDAVPGKKYLRMKRLPEYAGREK
jgi:hypothetical protein